MRECVGVMCTVLAIIECGGRRAHKQLFAELAWQTFDRISPCIQNKESNIIQFNLNYVFLLTGICCIISITVFVF